MANGFDKEYATTFLREKDYLEDKGINFTFKKTNEYGLKVYKYEKTEELFLALAEYYK